MKKSKLKLIWLVAFLLLGMLPYSSLSILAQDVLTPQMLLRIKNAGNAHISPAGKEILYTVSTPRTANEKPGRSYGELFIVNTETGQITPLITGKINISSPQWSTNGKMIAFLYRKKDDVTQVWMIPSTGGEKTKLTNSETSISSFKWRPGVNQIGYLSTTPASDHEKDLKERGYGFIFYEENLKTRNLYISTFNQDWKLQETKQITKQKTVWDFNFSPDGKKLAASMTDKNLVDYRYMFRKIYLVNEKDGSTKKISENEGKMGNYEFSPDGLKLTYTAAYNQKDHQVSQVFLTDLETGKVQNFTPENFKGHVNWSGWKNNKEVVYHSGEGVWPTLRQVNIENGKQIILLNGKDLNLVFGSPDFTSDFKNFTFTGSSAYNPGNVYFWNGKNDLKKLTDVNPEVKESILGKQQVVKYNARDGVGIEGLLIYPNHFNKTKTYPLVVYVHGGPEAHYSNRWVSRYSEAGQVLAGKGYLVFYPNYRASTGYGVDFALAGYEDPAGVEFDDIADGIDYLVEQGLADKDRVGLAGGSYGGYAAGWFATYYTKYVRAVCMFVGISDLISKRGTTDIAYEELYVHSGEKLEKQWKMNLERSPIYWAHQSKTAVLIYGGASDTRVHPSQSFEMHRRLKMNDHPAVRLVQYPGEGHGNRKQVGQIDVLYRHIQWLDWYVKEKKPLDGPMPPLDISNIYGLE